MAPSQSLLLLSAMAVCTNSLASGTRPVVRWRSRRLPTAAHMQEGGAQEVLLEGSELTQTFDGEQYQFRGVDVLLPRGSKQGLVGVNGVGKSSLLRVLAGVDAPESGDVIVSRNARVAYVEQEPTLPAGSTAADFVYRADAPAMSALREFNAAAEEAAGAVEAEEAEAAAGRLARASGLMDAADAWGLETEMKRLCTELGVAHLLERPAHTLSGGQRKRVALAAALLQASRTLTLALTRTRTLALALTLTLSRAAVGARRAAARRADQPPRHRRDPLAGAGELGETRGGDTEGRHAGETPGGDA